MTYDQIKQIISLTDQAVTLFGELVSETKRHNLEMEVLMQPKPKSTHVYEQQIAEHGGMSRYDAFISSHNARARVHGFNITSPPRRRVDNTDFVSVGT